MKALLVLVVAVGLCAPIVWFGPEAAELLLARFGGPAALGEPGIETVFTAVIFGALLLCALAGGLAVRVNPLRPGLRAARMSLAGALLGLFGVAAAAGHAWLAGTLAPGQEGRPDPALLLWGTAVVFFQAASEEIYFRGWLQPVLAERWGAVAGVAVAALAFAGLHVLGGARSPTTLANLVLGGLLFGLLAHRTRGIAAAVMAHFAWNGAEQIGLGLIPNPGVGSFGAMVDLDLGGAALWGGSEEGLNASLAMTIALLALLVPLLLLHRGGGAEVSAPHSRGRDRSDPARR